VKSPQFDYVKPSSLNAVFSLLEQHGDSARIMAGGQTLLATLNMRLSEPQLLIDISAVPGMRGISLQEKAVRIGAMTRHSEIEESQLIAQHMPLLAMAAPHVAHKAVRNRGTLGGSIVYADSAAEWPCCAVALDAVLLLASKRGLRRVLARDFFLELYSTALQPDEVLLACEFPLPSDSTRYAFDELARRHGDYAIVGLAASAQVQVQVQANTLSQLHLVFMGVGNTPVRASAAERALEGQPLTEATRQAASAALSADMAPTADLYNSAAMKMQLARVLLQRLLTRLTA
jgi:carbon-monoxide dehydrogenase medium subunit